MRAKKVGVAIVMNEKQEFLIAYNRNWHCYAFPMKDVEHYQDILPSTAIRALADDSGQPGLLADAKELEHLGEFGVSGSTGEDTLYEYWAYTVTPHNALTLPSGLNTPRFVSYSALIADPHVSASSKDIAKTIVENQEVALAVITRLGAAETEYLLVWNGNYGGYFFPATRVKQEFKPDVVARASIRADFGYRGEVVSTRVGEIDDVHVSNRFGRGRAYVFHICKVSLPALDLNQPLNLLEKKLQTRGRRWQWLNAAQLKAPAIPVSPTLAAVRALILDLIAPIKRTKGLRHSEGGIALINRQVNGQTEWLAQWNKHWKAFFFVGGHRHAQETFHDCVLRETQEELGLSPTADFSVATTARAELDYVAYSQSAQADTEYSMQLFDATIITEEAHGRVNSDPRNRWLTEREICEQEAFDARPVSVTMAMLLQKAGLLTC